MTHHHTHRFSFDPAPVLLCLCQSGNCLCSVFRDIFHFLSIRYRKRHTKKAGHGKGIGFSASHGFQEKPAHRTVKVKFKEPGCIPPFHPQTENSLPCHIFLPFSHRNEMELPFMEGQRQIAFSKKDAFPGLIPNRGLSLILQDFRVSQGFCLKNLISSGRKSLLFTSSNSCPSACSIWRIFPASMACSAGEAL